MMPMSVLDVHDTHDIHDVYNVHDFHDVRDVDDDDDVYDNHEVHDGSWYPLSLDVLQHWNGGIHRGKMCIYHVAGNHTA